MIIQHNMAAANVNRMLGQVGSAQAKSTEKLSSGYRINRAADDAAGLSISEKMRSQIRGLNQASTNAQDGISLIQTAEGALSESHSILQRMKELSVQAANGTETDVDRTAVQDEITALQEELTRISNDTEFNTMKLLNGSQAAIKEEIGANSSSYVGSKNAFTGTTAAITGSAVAAAMAAFDKTKTDTITVDGYKLTMDWSKALDELKYSKIDEAGIKAGTAATIGTDLASFVQDSINNALKESGANTSGVKVSVDAATNMFKIESASVGSGSLDIVGEAGSLLTVMGGLAGTTAAPKTATAGATLNTAIAGNQKITVEVNGQKVQLDTGAALSAGDALNGVASQIQTQLRTAIDDAMDAQGLVAGKDGFIDSTAVTVTAENGKLKINGPEGLELSFDDSAAAKALGLDSSSQPKDTTVATNGGITLQVGANEGQTITFSMNDMSAKALGVDGTNVDLSTQAGASKSITIIDEAIQKVSTERGKIGAIQNRLEHTINNLDTSSENLQSAESRIRDVDMASEMVEYSKNNILQQAAQSMLAQANQATQGVLSLLR